MSLNHLWHTDSEQRLSTLTFWHSLIYLVGVTWGFGGKIYWMETPMTYWGGVGLLLSIAGLIHRRNRGKSIDWPFACLAPAILYGIWVLMSSFNPNFTVVTFFETEVYRPVEPISWLPSSAVPSMTRLELFLQAGLFLSAYNVAINIGGRKRLLHLLYISSGNAICIAIFGTVQKLGGFGFFFGLVESPNPAFFGTFIYHNHWGAYALLSTACLIGFIGPLAKKAKGRGWTNSPAMIALLGIVLFSIAIPLSTSRSTTVLLLGLLGLGLTHAFIVFRNSAKKSGGSLRGPIFAAGIGIISIIIFLISVGEPILKKRAQITWDQFQKTEKQSYAAHRFLLYKDTWTFFEMRPMGGWGLESYHLTWRRFNTLKPNEIGPTIRYEEAHSDWLQSLAETGIIGTSLVALAIFTPIWIIRKRFWEDLIARYLILGVLTVTGYAWVEFPFANPAVVLTFWLSLFIAVRLSQLKVTYRTNDLLHHN